VSRSRTVSAGAVVSRVTAAIVGGYLLANLGSIALSYLLPGPQADAVSTGLLVSFLIYACAVLGVFAAKTAWRAWVGLLVSGLLCSLVIWQLVPEGLL
jgi:hypothetical protein